jgi:hypothetical protein
MTNASRIQAQIWKGNARAASKLGSPFNFYRPQAAHLQLEGGGNLQLEGGGDLSLEVGVQFPGSPLFVRCVSLNAEDMNYRKPSKYAKATWYAVMDGTGLKVGDYFIGQGSSGNMQLEGGGNLLLEDGTNLLVDGSGDTYFIAAMQPLLPIFVVECNRVVSLYKPQSQSGIGQQGYGGTTTQNQKLFVSGVPCSILQGTKGEKSETNLPGDTRSPWWSILMPASVGRIAQDDIIINDLGQRYIVSSNEFTDLGYRLTAMMAEA